MKRGYWLAISLFAAAMTRLLSLRHVLTSDGILPIGTDSFYHLWRIEYAVANSGLPPHFDSFVNAPYGAHVIYPDGFAWLLAAFARVIFGADATRLQIECTAMSVCVAVGVFAVYAVYVMTRSLFGDRAAIIAAFIAALQPLCAFVGTFGQVDHHMLELFLSAWALVVILREGKSDPANALTPRHRVMAIVLAGGLLAALHYTVPTAPLHVLLVLGSVIVALLRSAQQNESEQFSSVALTAAGAFAVGAILCVPDLPLRHGFAFYQPSLLTPSLLSLSAFLVVGLRAGVPHVRRSFIFPGALVAGGSALLTLILVYPDALSFIRGKGIIHLIAETQPVWRDFRGNLEMHGIFILLAPLCFVWVALRGDMAIWGMAAYGFCSLALTVFQLRFGYMLATAEAVMFAGSVTCLWSFFSEQRIVRWAALAIAFLPLLWIHHKIEFNPVEERALYEAATWFAKHTPSAGERKPVASPPYSILAPWAAGAQIAYWAHRPVIASGFFHGDYADGVNDSVNLYFSEADPLPLFEQRRIKYVMVLAADYAFTEHYLELHPRTGRLLRVPLQTQLFEGDGSVVMGEPEDKTAAPRYFPAIGWLRLVYVSSTQEAPRPLFKIFERVPGASLFGKCSGHAIQVQLLVPVQSPSPIEYVSWASCSASSQGTFRLLIPYTGSVRVSEDANAAPFECQISEDDVMLGKAVRCTR